MFDTGNIYPSAPTGFFSRIAPRRRSSVTALNFALTSSLTLALSFAITFAVTSTSFAASYDGPAELPRMTVHSAIADTPAPGSVIAVNAGGDLQSALNNAQCGDVIELQAGATFSGKFIVPAKNCNINQWIWIRTSAADSALPAEGQRVTPCYAGIASWWGARSIAAPTHKM